MTDIAGMILSGIRDFSANRPRSLQKEIGPSGLGNPCDHCLAAALVGWEKGTDEAWLPLIGTAVHALLLDGEDSPYGEGWMRETRVHVGNVDGIKVHGSADLFHVASGTVVDLKVVGLGTLNEARRHGASEQYRTQVQLYGRGFENAGFQVIEVVIAYLPRNSMRLSDAVFITYRYTPAIAELALDRATELLTTARHVEDISVMARDVWIDSLPRAQGCYDCARYPTIVQRPSSLAAEFATGERTHAIQGKQETRQ